VTVGGKTNWSKGSTILTFTSWMAQNGVGEFVDVIDKGTELKPVVPRQPTQTRLPRAE
jgi:hypothetical protein